MRPLAFVAVAVLVASAVYAPAAYRSREGGLPLETFVTADGAARAAWGEEHGALGVALTGYEQAAEKDPAALMDRIRLGFMLGARAMDEPNIHELVLTQARDYLAQRERIDPDGAKLQAILRDWLDARLHHRYHHARMATALYLATRGEAAGIERLQQFSREGPFHRMLYIYARRFKPGWRAIESLTVQYLESGQLDAVIEAGAALLEYNTLLGTGQDLLDRFLPDIRAAFREMKGKMGSFTLSDPRVHLGRTALFGLATLAARGEKEERTILRRMKKVAFPAFANDLDTARVWAGLKPLRGSFLTRDGEPKPDIDPYLIEYYFRAAIHRVAALSRRERTPQEDEALQYAFQVAEGGCRYPNMWVRAYCLHGMVAVGGERGQKVLREALDGGGLPSLFAGCLADRIDDKLALFLGGISAREPEYSAMAAVTLLDLDNDLRCLERPVRE